MALIVSHPNYCPNKNIRHETDDLKTMHSTKEAPIKVEEERGDRFVRWEYEYIEKILGLYHRCHQDYLEENGHKMDRLVARDYTGNHHVFYFDITAQIDADDAILKKAYEDMQAGKSIDPKLKALFEKSQEIQKKNQKRVILSADEARMFSRDKGR